MNSSDRVIRKIRFWSGSVLPRFHASSEKATGTDRADAPTTTCMMSSKFVVFLSLMANYCVYGIHLYPSFRQFRWNLPNPLLELQLRKTSTISLPQPFCGLQNLCDRRTNQL